MKYIVIAILVITAISFFNGFPYNSNQVFEAINKVRIENNLPALEYYSILENTAFQKIDEIEKNQYFGHGTNWSVKIKNKIPNYKVSGENLAKSQSDIETLVKAWMNSPLHKANILDKEFTKTGIAIKKISLNGVKQITVVQHFLG